MRRSTVVAFLNRAALAAAAWWVLTDGEVGWDWLLIGLPTVLAAAAVSRSLMPDTGWSWRGFGRFAFFFVRESLLGGIDVARRAFHPRLPLDPCLVQEPLRMPTDTGRVMVANTLGLLPGSLAVEVDEDELLVHALDAGSNIGRNIEATQAHVAGLIRQRPPRRGTRREPAR